MIVGNGLIASAFQQFDREDVIFFASGVSNSLETQKSEFEREKKLILKTIKEYPNALFIYFSTCSIYDSTKSNSLYVNHKLEMEQIIEKLPKYLIFRVSNAVGKGGNPNTLINYLVKAIHQKETIHVHTKATRNLVDVDDISRITNAMIDEKKFNKIVNLAYPENYTISELLEGIEDSLKVKADRKDERMGIHYYIEINDIAPYFQEIDKKKYLKNLLQKYYV